jgi:hypothetical protein
MTLVRAALAAQSSFSGVFAQRRDLQIRAEGRLPGIAGERSTWQHGSSAGFARTGELDS